MAMKSVEIEHNWILARFHLNLLRITKLLGKHQCEGTAERFSTSINHVGYWIVQLTPSAIQWGEFQSQHLTGTTNDEHRHFGDDYRKQKQCRTDEQRKTEPDDVEPNGYQAIVVSKWHYLLFLHAILPCNFAVLIHYFLPHLVKD